MRSAAYVRRGPSPVAVFLYCCTALLLGGGAVAAAFWGLGWLEWPGAPGKPPRPAGVAVPLSSRAIPAYTRLNRDHILDKAGNPVVIYLPAEEVARKGFLTLDDIRGRVLARDKAAGFAFTEKDLLPPGTRPGVVAGVPPGMRTFVLSATQVRGVHALKAGDSLDLVAAVTVEPEKDEGKLKAVALLGEGVDGPQKKRAHVKVLVTNGVVVTPVGPRPNEPPPPKGGKPNPPTMEITIAVAPAEVAALTEAIALNAQLVCVARSGQPGEYDSSIIPVSAPPAPRRFATIELIRNGKRETVRYLRPPDGESSGP